MRDRSKSLERVLAVQRQIVRLAEWRLGTLNQQCAGIKEDQARLHAFVSSEEVLSPLMSAAAFQRGQSLLGAIVKREAEAATQTTHTDTMRRRERLAEKLVEKVRAEIKHAAAKHHLEETIEASAWRDDASFP
jgi:hypothetical protein